MELSKLDKRLAILKYAKDLDLYKTVKPYSILTHFEDGMTVTNLEWETTEPEEIYNIRGCEQAFTLDDHGFAFLNHQTEFSDWLNRQAVEEQYLPQVVDLIKRQVDGADEVEVFDWRVSIFGAAYNILKSTTNVP